MYSRIAILALALAICYAEPQHGYGGIGLRGGYGGIGGGYGGISGGYGGISGGYGGLAGGYGGYGIGLRSGIGAGYGGGYGGLRGGYGGLRGGYGGIGGYRTAAIAPVAAVAAVPAYQKVAVAPVVSKVAAVPVEQFAPPHYSYEYSVQDAHTGDIKNQHEEREGDVTRGYYSLHEPDGTVRTVHYTVDGHNGFNAVVEKSGHAVHPQAVKVAHAAVPVAHAAVPIAHAAVPIARPAIALHGGYGHRAY